MANMKSIAAANREIDRLLAEVKELEKAREEMARREHSSRIERDAAIAQRKTATESLLSLKAAHAAALADIAKLRGYLKRVHEDDEIRDQERGLRREVVTTQGSVRTDPTFQEPSNLGLTFGRHIPSETKAWHDL